MQKHVRCEFEWKPRTAHSSSIYEVSCRVRAKSYPLEILQYTPMRLVPPFHRSEDCGFDVLG